MSYGLTRRRHSVKPSKLHGTVCPCGRESKEVWAPFGRNCYLRLPREMRDKIVIKRRGNADTPENRAHIATCAQWLRDNKEVA